MTIVKKWLAKIAVAVGLILFLPLVSSAATTQYAARLLTVDLIAYPYDAASDRVVNDNMLSESAASGRSDPFLGQGAGLVAAKSEANFVYRAINPKDAARLEAGLGLEAKNPAGTWSVGEHVKLGSGKASWANDPWLATTRDLDVARGFDGGRGIIAIDLSKVPSTQLKAWELYPRLTGEAGLPYHYSIWQQEVSVFQNIPREAIKGFVK